MYHLRFKCVNNLSILIRTKITAQIELTIGTTTIYEFGTQANLKRNKRNDNLRQIQHEHMIIAKVKYQTISYTMV